MGRRTILIILALVIATAGALLVFLYVQGVDDRAVAQTEPKQVLTASAPIEPGESVEDASAAGKIQLTAVPESAVLAGALDSTDSIAGEVATTTIYPGEQIIESKFGAVSDVDNLGIERKRMAVSVQLTDPNRVAGFVSPGSRVGVWVTWTDSNQVIHSRLLLEDVKVLGTGQTTVSSTTTTDASGAQTTEQIPLTILTLSVDQSDIEKLRVGEKMGELSLALRTAESQTRLDSGHDSEVSTAKSNSIFD